MRRDRSGISRDDAEGLLGGGSARPEADAVESARLAALLAAATASAQAGEQDGEDAAVAAFRDAFSPSARPDGATPKRSGLPLGRLFSAKIAVVAMAATAAGGIALASVTDSLPLLPSSPGKRQTPAASASPSPVPSAKQTISAEGPPPEPAQVRLCQSYQGAVKADPAKAQRDPIFAPLRSAAGGHGNVDGYCTRILAAAHTASPAPGNGQPHKPEKPEKPGKPTAPGKPTDPGKPDQPGKPAQPGKPGGDGKPKDSGKPGGKDKPEDQGKTGDKNKPATPAG